MAPERLSRLTTGSVVAGHSTVRTLASFICRPEGAYANQQDRFFSAYDYLLLVDKQEPLPSGQPPVLAEPFLGEKGGRADSFDGVARPIVGPQQQALIVLAKRLLRQLISLQYPWGEWGDRRTALESQIAERAEAVGAIGPKPNVARTLFAMEVLKLDETNRTQALGNAFENAIHWMIGGLEEGWYLEWRQLQMLDSDDPLPALERLPDVRHTAQVLSALCQWDPRYYQIDKTIGNLVAAPRTNGFWTDSDTSLQPRMLATVYVVEALGHCLEAENGEFLRRLLGQRRAFEVESVFKEGLTSVLAESNRGAGLLGASFQAPSSYLSGLALFRLASLADRRSDVAELAERLSVALSKSAGEAGWIDESVPLEVRGATSLRTSLRAFAGLVRCGRAGIPVKLDSSVVSYVANQARDNFQRLDAPDIACLLDALIGLLGSDGMAVLSGSSEVDFATMRNLFRSKREDCRRRLDAVRALQVGLGSGHRALARELVQQIEILDKALTHEQPDLTGPV